MIERQTSMAARVYRAVARLSARSLAARGAASSIALRRSAATGEVVFGASDIDLLAVVQDDVAARGSKLAEFYQQVIWAKRSNLRLSHLDVHRREGLLSLAKVDTFWASMERRTVLPLCGEPIDIPDAPVDPNHAVAKFGLWAEWFVPISIQRRSGRNLRKTALESWNAYAVAEGTLDEPFLLRSEMQQHLFEETPEMAVARLEDPDCAASFVFSLAKKMHRKRLPALKPLSEPLMFEATTAPLSLRRLFVVVPRESSALPRAAFAKGAWPCTPELLHLYVTYTNPFVYWSFPEELKELGMEPPSPAGFLRACRYYGHERFLTHPGFASPSPAGQQMRLDYIEYALEQVRAGKSPAPVSETRLTEGPGGAADCLDYYRNSYDELRSRSRQLEETAETYG